MGKKQRIIAQRQKKALAYLDKEVNDLGVIRKALIVSQNYLQKADRKRILWKNAAVMGIPAALLAGLALGIAVAHKVLNSGL